MSHYGSVREQWRMFQNVVPLFYSASLRPISDGVDDDDSGASDDVERIHLQYAITALRTDLKLSMLRRSYIDIDNDDLEAHRDSWYFASSLWETSKTLETLIDNEFPLMPEDWVGKPAHELTAIDSFYRRNADSFLPQFCTMAADSLQFPRLISLREALREHEFKHRLPHENSHWINRVLGDSRLKMPSQFLRTGSSLTIKYTLDSIQELSRYICFPRDYKRLRGLRKILSDFQVEVEDMMSRSVTRYTSEVKMNSFTTIDAQIIAHVDGFASACTSLFTQIADNTTCGERHVARVHLSGFKKDQLKMDIQTTHYPGTVSAVFTKLVASAHSNTSASSDDGEDPSTALQRKHLIPEKYAHLARRLGGSLFHCMSHSIEIPCGFRILEGALNHQAVLGV